MGKSSILFPLKVFLVVLGFFTVVTTFVFAFLNSTPQNLETSGNNTFNSAPGIFLNDIESLGLKYPTNNDPASWVFSIIWAIIFVWNSISGLYMVVSLFLARDQSPVKRNPALIPVTSSVCWILAWGGALSWVFTYDREYFGVSLFFLIFTAWNCYAFLGFSYRNYFSDILILEENSPKMLWTVRILVHNGFGIFTTWITCAWKLNLVRVIAYVYGRDTEQVPAELRSSLTVDDAATIALSLLLVEIIVWFILENFMFEKYCRYTLTIYPVLIFAFSGIFVANYVYPYSRNQALTVAGLVIACVAFVARIFLVVIRHRNRIRCA